MNSRQSCKSYSESHSLEKLKIMLQFEYMRKVQPYFVFGAILVFSLFGIWFFVLESPSSEPKIDGSSIDAYEASIKRVYEDLNQEDRNELQRSIAFIGMKDSSIAEMAISPESVRARLLVELDGMTAEEIIKWANGEIRMRSSNF